jgi:hypothetical protein
MLPTFPLVMLHISKHTLSKCKKHAAEKKSFAAPLGGFE